MIAKKTTKRNSKPKTTKPVTKPPTAAMSPELGYAGHKLGSRKGTIHELFDKEGEDVAWTRGLKVGLKPGTLRSWFVGWKRVQSNTKNKTETNSSTPPAIKPDGLSATSETAYP